MAEVKKSILASLKSIAGVPDLRKRVFFLLGLLAVGRFLALVVARFITPA